MRQGTLPAQESKDFQLTNLGWISHGMVGIESVLKHVDDLLPSEKKYLESVLIELEKIRSKRTHV